MSEDTRVVYGAVCTWWDSIDKVSTTPSGLPCCPYCGGVLFEMPNEEYLQDENAVISTQYNINYQAAMDWVRGKCSVYLGWSMPRQSALPPIYLLYLSDLGEDNERLRALTEQFAKEPCQYVEPQDGTCLDADLNPEEWCLSCHARSEHVR